MTTATANVNACNKGKRTRLWVAARTGQIGAIRELLAAGAKVDAVCYSGYAPLHAACSGGHADAVGLLLAAGAKVNRRGLKNATPLVFACDCDSVSVARVLVNHRDIDINLPDDLQTPLMYACHKENSELVQLLLSHGARTDIPDRDGWLPTHIAVRQPELLRALLAAGAKVDGLARGGCSPLHTACQGGHIESAHVLLSAGAKVNRRGDSHVTPLLIACEKGNVDMARMLLAHGARTDMPTATLPLHMAIAADSPGVVRALLGAGAAVNAPDTDGANAIHWVCQCASPRTDILQDLIGAGADFTAPNSDGDAPADLMAAAIDAGEVTDDKLCITCHARCHRKCPCLTARYCDVACQRAHRLVHKTWCRLMLDAL